MPEILGDVRTLAYVERWAKKEGVLAKSAFCGQKAKFAGRKKIIHLNQLALPDRGRQGGSEDAENADRGRRRTVCSLTRAPTPSRRWRARQDPGQKVRPVVAAVSAAGHWQLHESAGHQ